MPWAAGPLTAGSSATWLGFRSGLLGVRLGLGVRVQAKVRVQVQVKVRVQVKVSSATDCSQATSSFMRSTWLEMRQSGPW